MDQIDKTKDVTKENATGFLSDKPIWVWWITYTILVSSLFGIFYFAWTLLTEKWWGIAIVILLTSIIWSTISYKKQKPKSEMTETK